MEDKKLNDLKRDLYIVQNRLEKERTKRMAYMCLAFAILGAVVSMYVVEFDGFEAILEILVIIVACAVSLSIISLLILSLFSFITASFTNIYNLEDLEKDLQYEIKRKSESANHWHDFYD